MSDFDPDWAVSPGAIMYEKLVEWAAVSLGWTCEKVETFLKGQLPIDDDDAASLSIATGISAGAWLNLEEQCRQKRKEQGEKCPWHRCPLCDVPLFGSDGRDDDSSSRRGEPE